MKNIEFTITNRSTMIVYYGDKKAIIPGESAYEPTRFYAQIDSLSHWESPNENITVGEEEKQEIVNYITNNSESLYNFKVIFLEVNQIKLQQKNSLLKVYLSQFGIGKLAENYAIACNIKNYQECINEFKLIQENIFDYIWKITEPNKQLSAYEIEKICATYCFEHYQWINEIGLKALNSWLIWLCWHEGILAKDSNV